jgi:DNA-binding IclR family transcriptional regulator
MRNSSSTLTSVDNALQVLDLLGRRPYLRVIDVAEHLSVGRATAHRILAALLERGFVIQDASRKYRAGPAFDRIRHYQNGDDPRGLRDIIHRHLVKLSRELSETCNVGVLEGNGVRFIDSVESSHTLRISSRVGILLPAHLTAIGVTTLSELTHEALRALYPRGIGSNKEIASVLQELERKIRALRRNGYARNNGEHGLGIHAVAMALRSPSGQAFAGVSVTIPTQRFEPRAVPGLVDGLGRMVEAVRAELAGGEGFAPTPEPSRP